MHEESTRDLDVMAKGWSIATKYSRKRLSRVYEIDSKELDDKEGLVLLETVCLFVHSCVKSRQYILPPGFWRVLHLEYGIVVYPSALTECIDVQCLGVDFTFTEAYEGHIVMFPKCAAHGLPSCPFECFREAPPKYDEVCRDGIVTEL